MKAPLILALLFFISFSSSQIFSQDDLPQERENSLKAGKWALQFAIDQNFSLSNFQGNMISIKKQFNDKRALRLGLSLSFGKDKRNGTYISNSDTIKPTVKGTQYSISLYPTYFFYLDPKATINLYLGAGLKIGGSFESNENKEPLLPTGVNYHYDRYYTYNAGVTGTAGVEFFPIKSLSVFAEYFAVFEYYYENSYHITDVPGTYGKNEYKSDVFQFDGRRVNFGLSVYF